MQLTDRITEMLTSGPSRSSFSVMVSSSQGSLVGCRDKASGA